MPRRTAALPHRVPLTPALVAGWQEGAQAPGPGRRGPPRKLGLLRGVMKLVRNACKHLANTALHCLFQHGTAKRKRKSQVPFKPARVVPGRLRTRHHTRGAAGRSGRPKARVSGAKRYHHRVPRRVRSACARAEDIYVRQRGVAAAGGAAHASAARGVALCGRDVQAPAAAADHWLPPHGRARGPARPAPAQQ